MAGSLQVGQASDGGSAESARHRARHAHGSHAPRPGNFQQVLLRAFQGKVATARYAGHAHPAAARVAAAPVGQATTTTPAAALSALSQAMTREGVPASWQSSLAFIMNHESGGQVGVQSPWHSARGLFQLTAANYHYNPNGAASFGNAVEEAQGGIRYIRARYGTPDKAVAFWQAHQWY